MTLVVPEMAAWIDLLLRYHCCACGVSFATPCDDSQVEKRLTYSPGNSQGG